MLVGCPKSGDAADDGTGIRTSFCDGANQQLSMLRIYDELPDHVKEIRLTRINDQISQIIIDDGDCFMLLFYFSITNM